MGSLSGKKVIFILAPANFRDEEYFQPKVVLQSQGAEVLTVAKGDPEEMTGTQGGKARTDAKFADINPETVDGLIFVGGAGASTYFNYKTVHKQIQAFAQANKILGAICIAPSILANADILKGKKVTASESQKENLQAKGAKYQNQAVVVDDNIITANGPEAAIAFGEALAKALVA
ncbi:hypothetical protein GYA49_00510 [Candidatus Beckwithbacteria bacterium]|nr:hypothetical protein [Candidatus Beckwithbacteria bacterium]